MSLGERNYVSIKVETVKKIFKSYLLSVSRILNRILFLILLIITTIIPDFLLSRPPVSWLINFLGRITGLDHHCSYDLMGIIDFLEGKEGYSGKKTTESKNYHRIF